MVKLPSIQITVSCGSHKTTSHDAISYFTAEKLSHMIFCSTPVQLTPIARHIPFCQILLRCVCSPRNGMVTDR